MNAIELGSKNNPTETVESIFHILQFMKNIESSDMIDHVLYLITKLKVNKVEKLTINDINSAYHLWLLILSKKIYPELQIANNNSSLLN